MPTILVADDDPDIRNLLTEVLSVSGFSVTMASNGREAVAATREINPDLIIMDMNMPSLTGYDAIRTIRWHHGMRPAIVGLTAHANAADYDEAYRAGCDAFISKPFRPAHLLERIHSLLNVHT